MPLDRSIYDFSKLTPQDLGEGPKWNTFIGKSTKTNKKTGVSPRETALATIIKSATDKLAKESLARTNAANEAMQKIAGADFKASQPPPDTTPEQAQKQQDKEWAAAVEGLKAAWVKGQMPRQQPPPVVGTPNLKDNAPPATSDTGQPVSNKDIEDAANAAAAGATTSKPDVTAPNVVYPKGVVDPTTVASQAPVVTPKVAALQNQIAGTQQTLDAIAAANPKKENPILGFIGRAVNDIGHAPLKAPGALLSGLNIAGSGLLSPADELWRMGAAEAQAAWEQKTLNPTITPDWDTPKPQPTIPDPNNPGQQIPNPNYAQEVKNYRPVATNIWDALNIGGSEAWHQKGPSGEQVLHDINPTVAKIPGVGPVGGFALETAADPTNYVDLGIGTALKRFGLEVAPQALIDIENQATRGAIKAGTVSLAEKGGRTALKKAESQAKQLTKPLVQAGAQIGDVSKHAQAAQDAFDAGIKAGLSPGKAAGNARYVAVNSILADIATQKKATAMLNAAKDNRRYISVKIAGKETGLGKRAAINVPYQAVQALKGKALETKVGQDLSKAFNINYWFPGTTHDLHNKAEAMGVEAFHQNINDVREAFKGLSTADRNRIATETELGHSLAGVTGEKGIDLGPAQKFFKDATDKMFNEDVMRGKYSPEQKVADYVFHYYRKGDSKEIDAFREARKARLTAGATGADRITLAAAKEQGLKPVEGADRILLAQMADHQRQMINDSFNRRMIDQYGHVTDNQFLVHSLGMEKVKPPKNMQIPEGFGVYMNPEAARVYNGAYELANRNGRAASGFLGQYDKIMKYWKIGNTSVRPGHHIKNAIGDIYMNYLDGVRNPYRYRQGLQMVNGNRANLRVKVGNQILNGDQIADLGVKGGLAHGYIASEFGEGRNPLMHGINELSDRREMFARYAHFIDSLKKEGDRVNLGANNSAGLIQAATKAARDVNKWNINYGDLTPFERNFVKRAVPFYTFSRKAIPLIMEAAITHPGRINTTTRLEHLMSNLAGVDPMDLGPTPFPQWQRQLGIARLSDGPEPLYANMGALPVTEPAKWLGAGNYDDVIRSIAGNMNPVTSMIYARATGKNPATGANIPSGWDYWLNQVSGVQNAMDVFNAHRGGNDLVNAINKATGLGVYRDKESDQLSELRRQQTPLNIKMSQANKALGTYEVHKTKYAWSVYNKILKITEKDGFSSPAAAYMYAAQKEAENGKQNKQIADNITKQAQNALVGTP